MQNLSRKLPRQHRAIKVACICSALPALVLCLLICDNAAADAFCYQPELDLDALMDADPVVDAREAIDNRDYCFLKLAGHSYLALGILNRYYVQFTHIYGIREIEHFDLWPSIGLPGMQMRMVYRYIEQYNRVLFEHLYFLPENFPFLP